MYCLKKEKEKVVKDRKNDLVESYYNLKKDNVAADEWEVKYKEAAQNNKNEYYESYMEKRKKRNSQ